MTEELRVFIAITATIASAFYFMAIEAVFLHVAADETGIILTLFHAPWETLA